MLTGLLPIGTVVLLKESTKKIDDNRRASKAA